MVFAGGDGFGRLTVQDADGMRGFEIEVEISGLHHATLTFNYSEKVASNQKAYPNFTIAFDTKFPAGQYSISAIAIDDTQRRSNRLSQQFTVH
jgi:hypothetical protein